MRRLALILVLFFLVEAPARGLTRRPLELSLAPEGTYLTEEISLSADEVREARLPFPGRINPGNITVLEAPEGCLVSFIPQGFASPQGPVAEEIHRTRAELSEISREEEVLSLEEKWLLGLSPRDLARDPLSALKRLGLKLEEIKTREAELERKRAALKKRLLALEERLALKEETLLSPVFRCERIPSTYTLKLRYPLSGLEYREERRVFVWPEKSRVEFRLGLWLTQRLGRSLPELRLRYEVRPRGPALYEPPPFRPWYVDTPPIGILALKAPGAVKGGAPSAEPLLEGRLYRVPLPALSPGLPRFVLLERREFPARVRVEVPAYSLPRAYLAVTLRPEVYLPGGPARIFLSGRELPERKLPDLRPGRKLDLYLSEDPWVEVRRRILRDYEERVGVVKKHLRRTLRWEIEIKSAHPQGLPLTVYERVPVSRKKEIRVSVTADPPWNELSPQGRATWHLTLSPGKPLKILLQAVIERPAP